MHAREEPRQTAGGREGDRVAAWVRRHPRETAVGLVGLTAAGLLQQAGAPGWAVLGLAAVGAAGALIWPRRDRPQHRSKIEVIGGSRWPWRWHDWRWDREARGELNRIVGIWDWIAERAGIPHSRVTRAVADPDEGYSLYVDLARGQVPRDIHPDRLASALREFPHRVLPGERAHQVVIRELVEEESGAAPAADAWHDDGGEETATPGPEPVNLPDHRMQAVLVALRAHGALSARGVGRATGIDKDTVRTLLDELARRRQVTKGEDGKWNLASEVAA